MICPMSHNRLWPAEILLHCSFTTGGLLRVGRLIDPAETGFAEDEAKLAQRETQ